MGGLGQVGEVGDSLGLGFLNGWCKWGRLMGAVLAEWTGCRLTGDGKGR